MDTVPRGNPTRRQQRQELLPPLWPAIWDFTGRAAFPKKAVLLRSWKRSPG